MTTMTVTLVETTDRPRATRLRPLDSILVQWDQERRWDNEAGTWVPQPVLHFSGRKAPRRAFWVVVKSVDRTPGYTGVESITFHLGAGTHTMAAKGDFAVTRLTSLKAVRA